MLQFYQISKFRMVIALYFSYGTQNFWVPFIVDMMSLGTKIGFVHSLLACLLTLEATTLSCFHLRKKGADFFLATWLV